MLFYRLNKSAFLQHGILYERYFSVAIVDDMSR